MVGHNNNNTRAEDPERQPLLVEAPAADRHHDDHDHGVPKSPVTVVYSTRVVGGDSSDGGDDENDALSSSDAAEGSLDGVRSRLKFIFPALAIGLFLAAGDQTIIVSSYGRIGSDLNELNKSAWLATAYLCTTTAFQPLYGRLADVLGRKPCLLFAYSVFGLGALLCGLALDMNQLIIARALTGVGSGGIITMVSILLSDVVPLEERGIWQGYVNMVFAIGGGLGAPLGGVLTDAVGWRWAFLGQAPLCAVAILLVAVLLHLPTPSPSPSPTTPSVLTRLSRVDFPGAATLITTLVLFLILLDVLSSPQRPDKTHHPSPLLLAVLTPLGLALYLYIQARGASSPLTPLRLLLGRRYLGAYLALALANVAWYGALFYVPLLYQAVGGYSASGAGAGLLPGILSGIIGGLAGGSFVKRRRAGGYRALALLSYPLVATSCVSLAASGGLLHPPNSSSPSHNVPALLALSASLLVGGLGNGAGMTATLVVVVVVAPAADQAVVTACIYMYRQLGTTVGLAVVSLVFRRVLAAGLLRRLGGDGGGGGGGGGSGWEGLDVDEVVRRVSESLSYLERLPAGAREVVRAAYGDACRAALLVSAGLAACAVVAALFIREKRKE
ncbi:MFS general substrate transporter [Biscogniauxia mediterranea]|nr:MFS general substrate transporter [Biscogniauxia mediterranea]